MKNLLLGAVLGAGALYLAQRSKQEGGLGRMCDEVKDYAGKVKKTAKDTWDQGVNQAEYMKDRVEDKADMAHAQVKDAVNK